APSCSGIAISPIACNRSPAMMSLEVLNPVALSEGDVKASGAAPRPASLDGLRLGLIWNAKRGGDVALVKAGQLIQGQCKDVKVSRYDSTRPCEKSLLEKAKQECDVFIISTGD